MTKLNFSALTLDQIDRLIMEKSHDISKAASDYSFNPRKFQIE